MLKYTILWKLDPSIKYWDDKKRRHWDDRRRGTWMIKKGATWMTREGATWMTPITLLFQRVTLESRNFIRSVSIKVMLKCAVLMEN
ncbi:MAG: hypothetical protein LJD31_02200 [Wolbachia endosymbiont of Menacanthus eurysternus]|nr:hypothetical protein [Wolbachia endosymbiont of Menacanthus eurysternus]